MDCNFFSAERHLTLIQIAITKMAVQSALGTNLPETVEAIRTGVVGIRIPVHLEQELLLSARAGEVPDSASCAGDSRGWGRRGRCRRLWMWR